MNWQTPHSYLERNGVWSLSQMVAVIGDSNFPGFFAPYNFSMITISYDSLYDVG